MGTNIKNILNNSVFLKNVFTLASGTTVAQVISVVTIPILYQIYKIEDYGTLGLYGAMVGVLSIFSTMQYINAIILEETDTDALKILRLNRFINIIVTIIIFFLILIFKNIIVSTLNAPAITSWLMLIPISIFFLGQGQILRTWANRHKRYQYLQINSIIYALTVPFISLILGYIYNGWILGLFVGLLGGHILPSIILFIQLNKNGLLNYGTIDIGPLLPFVRKYSNYPKYTLLSEFISNFSHKLPIFFLSSYFGSTVVGLFDLSQKVLGMPSSIISNAVKEVYKEKASFDFKKNGSFKDIFLTLFKSLSVISILGFGLMSIIAPDIFAFVFGEAKREAGHMARIMCLIYGLRFISSPLSFGFDIRKKQHIGLYGSIWFSFSSILVFYISNLNSYTALTTISIFAINFAVMYLVMMIYNYRISTQ